LTAGQFPALRQLATRVSTPPVFDYLTELQRHIPDVAAASSAWMPWNYRPWPA